MAKTPVSKKDFFIKVKLNSYIVVYKSNTTYSTSKAKTTILTLKYQKIEFGRKCNQIILK